MPQDFMTNEVNNQTKEFIQLLILNHDQIYAYILSMVHSWVDADDIFQETSVIMWNKFGQYETGTNFHAWAVHIARFQVFNYRRKNSGKAVQMSEELMDLFDDRYSKLEKKKSEQRSLNNLQDCVSKLVERDRKMITMRYEQSCTVGKMAESVGMSRKALYKNLARIHDMLLRCVRRSISAEEGL